MINYCACYGQSGRRIVTLCSSFSRTKNVPNVSARVGATANALCCYQESTSNFWCRVANTSIMQYLAKLGQTRTVVKPGTRIYARALFLFPPHASPRFFLCGHSLCSPLRVFKISAMEQEVGHRTSGSKLTMICLWPQVFSPHIVFVLNNVLDRYYGII